MRGMIRRALAAASAVIEAADGPVDLILTDVNVPRNGGFKFVEEVRQDSRFACTPILALTTESAPEIKQRGKTAGATGWIVKPFRPDDLCSVVAMILKKFAARSTSVGQR
jgi:two-component system chemotaxis response regulator CheY